MVGGERDVQVMGNSVAEKKAWCWSHGMGNFFTFLNQKFRVVNKV